MQRLGEPASCSCGRAGGGGGTVTTAGCSVCTPEIAILIQGSQAPGTFISPDLQGQEGAPRNRAEACGVGDLMRRCWGGWGTPLPGLLSRDPSLPGRVGGGTLRRFPQPRAIPLTELVTRGGLTPPHPTPTSRQLRHKDFFFRQCRPPPPPAQCRLQRSRGRELGCSSNPGRPRTWAQFCSVTSSHPHHTHSPPSSARPELRGRSARGLTGSLLP